MLSAARAARADCSETEPWSRLGVSFGAMAEPAPLALSGAAVLAPLAMSPSGADHRLRVVAQRDLGGEHNLEPVSVIGPYALAGGTLVGYAVTRALSLCAPARIQAAVLQALGISWATAFTLKWAVGRQWPNGGLDPEAPDRLEHPEWAREYSPFALRLSAWPSGHSATMFAAAAALRASGAELGVARWLGYPLALGVAGGMWLGDHHWASDIVSGALFGEAIGSSVGSSFGTPSASSAFVIVPLQDEGMLVVYAGLL